MNMAINTVNVIEYYGEIRAVHAFSDNPEGNKQAEELFKKLAQKEFILTKRRFSDEEIEVGLEDGYLETNDDWKLYITHSTPHDN